MRSLPVIPVLPHERLICLDYIYRPLHLSKFLNQRPVVADSCQIKAELVGDQSYGATRHRKHRDKQRVELTGKPEDRNAEPRLD